MCEGWKHFDIVRENSDAIGYGKVASKTNASCFKQRYSG